MEKPDLVWLFYLSRMFSIFNKQHPSIRFAILLAGAYALVLAFLFPDFHTTDDLGIITVVSGYFGAPDAHTLFTHYYFGFFLKLMYTWLPSFAWYEWTLVLITFLSWICIHHALRVLLPSRFLNLIVVVLFLSIGLLFLCNLHFSFTASLAGCASMMILRLLILNKDSSKTGVYFFLLLLFAFLSICVRPESFFVCFILFMPPFAIYALKHVKSGKSISVHARYYTTILLAFSGVLFWLNVNVYRQDAEWSKFWTYFKARASFTDYSLPYSESAAKAANWSLNDYIAIRNWFYADTNVYSLEHFEKYKAISPTVSSKSFSYFKKLVSSEEPRPKNDEVQLKPKPEVNQAIALAKDSTSAKPEARVTQRTFGQQNSNLKKFSAGYLRGNSLNYGFLVLLFLTILVLFGFSSSNIIHAVVIGLGGLAFLLFIAITLKLPAPRILVSVMSTMIFALLSFVRDPSPSVEHFRFSKLGVSLLSIVALWILYVQVGSYHGRKAEQGRRVLFLSSFEELKSKYPGYTLLAWNPGFTIIDLYEPFQTSATQKLAKSELVFLGAYYGSPIGSAFDHKHGLTHIGEDLFRKENLLVFSNSEMLELYSHFALEHYGVKIQYKLIDSATGAFTLKPIAEEVTD